MPENKLTKQLLPIILLGLLGLIAVPIYTLLSSQQETNRDLERIAHINLIDERMRTIIREGKDLPIPQNPALLYF